MLSGSLLVALPVAAGRPGWCRSSRRASCRCCPGYLSYATGLSGVDLEDAKRGRMVLGSFLFVLGFSFVFVALGTLSGSARRLADRLHPRDQRRARPAHDPGRRRVRRRWCRWLQRDVRMHKVPAVGLAAAPLLGVLFGARLDALHRPDPVGGPGAGAATRAPPPAARCSASPTRSASASRSSWPGWRSAGCSAP